MAAGVRTSERPLQDHPEIETVEAATRWLPVYAKKCTPACQHETSAATMLAQKRSNVHRILARVKGDLKTSCLNF